MALDTPFSEEVQKRIESLPPDIKALVYSADMASIVQQIGKRHALHIDQVGLLEAEAAAVMIGLAKPEEFVQNLSDVLDIDAQKSTAVAKDINEMLFLKIRNSMKGAVEESFPATTAAPEPVASSPAPLKSQLPSSAKLPTPPPIPNQTPAAVKPATPQAPAPKPQVPLAPHPHDLMLTEKTVTTPPPAPKPPPSKPQNYQKDPYREPVEP